MNTREAIFAALFAQLSTATGFTTVGRTLKHWDNVPAGDQPALFQAEGRQTATSEYRKPTKWLLHAELYIYVHHSSPSSADDVVATLNAQVDAVMTALARDGAGVQTLGGVVEDCRVQGDIETDEGRLGEQAVAIIPLEIIPLI